MNWSQGKQRFQWDS